MRDIRFVAVHRGGLLKKEQHRQLIIWACDCIEHILPKLEHLQDVRFWNAIEVAKKWEAGNASVGDARKASVACIELAREMTELSLISITRAAGHAVATAHMADHSLGGALYSLKALKQSGYDIEAEKLWQFRQLTTEIREQVLDLFAIKAKSFKFE